jgi:Domain of unknown function (DUF4419)
LPLLSSNNKQRVVEIDTEDKMMHSDQQEKESVAGSSSTEGSHTKTDSEEANPRTYEGGFREGKKVVAPAPRRPILYCVGILAVIALVIVLPSVLLHGNNSEEGSKVDNSQESVYIKVPSSPPLATSPTTNPPVVYDAVEDTAKENAICEDNHIPSDEDRFREVSSIWALGLSLGQRDDAQERTFEVEHSHELWEKGPGVIFNVETVSEALPEDLAKPILTESDLLTQIQQEAREFYQNQTALESVYPPPPPITVTLEVMSRDDRPLVFAGSQSFLAASMMAFAQHLPLALMPDHLWILIVQGFARHVDQHAEELRGNFVSHEGKKKIEIREDRMVKGQTPSEQWEEWIFPQFSESIGENMVNEDVRQTLAGKHFSTATATSQAASEIVLMAAFTSYFEYSMVTACGIPQVRLEGTRDDWVALRDNTAKLADWMMPNNTHGELWIKDIVVPILEQFIMAYDGHVSYCFWQTMVKFRTSGGGSGSYEFLSGWLPTLFPYLSMGPGEIKPNPYLRRWEESASALLEGPQPSHIPSQLSSVPVNWEYFGEVFPLHFHAGFRGVTQESDGTVAPVLGYYATNDPIDA